MAGSASGQDEPNPDWPPEQARWAYLALSGLLALFPQSEIKLFGGLVKSEKLSENSL